MSAHYFFECEGCSIHSVPVTNIGRTAAHLERWFAAQGWTCAPHPLCATCSRAAAYAAIAPLMLCGMAALLVQHPAACGCSDCEDALIAVLPELASTTAALPAWRRRPAAVFADRRPLYELLRLAPPPIVPEATPTVRTIEYAEVPPARVLRGAGKQSVIWCSRCGDKLRPGAKYAVIQDVDGWHHVACPREGRLTTSADAITTALARSTERRA